MDDDSFQWWLAFEAFVAPEDVRQEEDIYRHQDKFVAGFVKELLGG